MKQHVKAINEKFESIAVRERFLVIAVTIALLYIVFDFLVLQSTVKKIDVLKTSEEVMSKEITATNSELDIFESKITRDPNLDLKEELLNLEEKLSALDESLRNFSVGLITYDNLPVVLHDVLQKNQHLKLQHMETLPSEEINLGGRSVEQESINKHANSLNNPVLSQSLKDTDGARTESRMLSSVVTNQHVETVKLYKHAVDLTFVGTYKDVEDYIEGLENGRWRFYWETLGYTVTSYPSAEINLQVYTLSSDRGAFDGY